MNLESSGEQSYNILASQTLVRFTQHLHKNGIYPITKRMGQRDRNE